MTESREPLGDGRIAHIIALTRSVVPPMHPAGRPFVVRRRRRDAASCAASPRRLGVLGAVLTGGIAWFFREPKRVTPSRSNIVVAAADGTVSHVVLAEPPAELACPPPSACGSASSSRSSTCTSSACPRTARSSRAEYHPGKFLSADLDKASEDNERNALLLRTADGHDVVVVQIAGLLARRIVCDVAAGDKVARRRDLRPDPLRLPRRRLRAGRGAGSLVEPGQRTIGGETVLAELPVA